MPEHPSSAPASATTQTPRGPEPSEADQVAAFAAVVSAKRLEQPITPEPVRGLQNACQRILDGIPPAMTPEQIAESQRREEQAVIRQAQAEREWKVQSLFAERGNRYVTCTLSNYQADTDAQKRAVEKLLAYAKELDQRVKAGESIVIFGPAGTGKDHLLAAMMRAAITAYGLTVHWENGMDLFGEIRDRMGGDQSEAVLIRSLCRPDILALSDPLPPFGPLSQFQANMLFRVIDGRYSQGKPTWVTLNCSGGEEAEARMGVQMVDRLRHGALTIHADWPSYRKAK